MVRIGTVPLPFGDVPATVAASGSKVDLRQARRVRELGDRALGGDLTELHEVRVVGEAPDDVEVVLDDAHRAPLIEQVRDQGRTVCVVEHNLHVVGRLADHTYFMELGEITAQGTIAELTSTPRLAEVYFGTS